MPRANLLALIAILAAPACTPDAAPVSDGWHRREVPECGVSVELPGAVHRSDDRLPDGSRSIQYRTDENPDLYMLFCIPPVAGMPPLTPAQALRGQLANHESPTEVGAIGVAIADSGVTDAPDGGRYWITFENGMRIEGDVHLIGQTIVDLSGSATVGSPRSRAALDRVLASYRAR
jgi:hypothetical protein